MKTKANDVNEEENVTVYENLDCFCKGKKGKLEYVGDYETTELFAKERIVKEWYNEWKKNNKPTKEDLKWVEWFECEKCGYGCMFAISHYHGHGYGAIVGETYKSLR